MALDLGAKEVYSRTDTVINRATPTMGKQAKVE